VKYVIPLCCLCKKSSSNPYKQNQIPFILTSYMFRCISDHSHVHSLCLKHLFLSMFQTQIVNLKMTLNMSKHAVLYNRWNLFVFGRILTWFLIKNICVKIYLQTFWSKEVKLREVMAWIHEQNEHPGIPKQTLQGGRSDVGRRTKR
jgi:hypothetical protein